MAYNLLLVDDSSIVRKVIIKSLAMTEIPVNKVYEAENGQQALDVLRANWIDLVFLDINMPVMNGIEFMQALRADAKLKDTPVMVVSTEGSKERKELLHELGVRVYLRKPVTPEALAESVSALLGGAMA